MLGDSWDAIVIAYVLPSMRQEWGLDTLTIGAMISAGYGGQLLGSLSLGPAAEKFGRLPVFASAILAMCAFSLASAVTRDLHVFFALRFLEGFALGGALPACISYVNELAPTATRGRYFSLFQFVMVSGYPLVSITAPFVIPAFGWRTMFYLGAAPALFVPLMLMTLPESPRWLARCGRIADANKALARLGAPPVDENLPQAEEETRKVPMAALFAPEYRKRTTVVSLLWFGSALVSFAFATWVPTLYVQVYHTTPKASLQYAAIASGIYIFVPLVFAAIIDAFGRRRPAMTVNVIAFVSLIALILTDHAQTTLVVTFITTGWIAAAAGTIILWPYTAEIFPTHMRSTGLGMSSSLARAASMLTPLVVGGTLAATGSVQGVFGFMAACAFAVTVLWWRYTQETAKKSLEETAAAA